MIPPLLLRDFYVYEDIPYDHASDATLSLLQRGGFGYARLFMMKEIGTRGDVVSFSNSDSFALAIARGSRNETQPVYGDMLQE